MITVAQWWQHQNGRQIYPHTKTQPGLPHTPHPLCILAAGCFLNHTVIRGIHDHRVPRMTPGSHFGKRPTINASSAQELCNQAQAVKTAMLEISHSQPSAKQDCHLCPGRAFSQKTTKTHILGMGRGIRYWEFSARCSFQSRALPALLCHLPHRTTNSEVGGRMKECSLRAGRPQFKSCRGSFGQVTQSPLVSASPLNWNYATYLPRVTQGVEGNAVGRKGEHGTYLSLGSVSGSHVPCCGYRDNDLPIGGSPLGEASREG